MSVSFGVTITVKLVALVAVPSGVVTEIDPLVAPAGTRAVIFVSLATLKLAAATPLKLTALAPLKPVPVRVTRLPTKPEVGVKELMVGAVPMVKA